MNRSNLYRALTVVVMAVGGLIYTLSVGNKPLLGLDLQGGVSVVLEPTEDASDEALDQALEIIRSRVDGLGVAEPEISRQGQTIVVDLPGVDEQQRALELVGQTAELNFRPVLLDPSTMAFLLGEESLVDQLEGDIVVGDGTDSTNTDTTDATDGETDVTSETDSSDETEGTEGDDEQSLSPIRSRQTTTTEDGTDEVIESETTEVVEESTTTDGEVTGDVPLADDETVVVDDTEVDEFTAFLLDTCSAGITEDPAAEDYAILESISGGTYCLGPVFVGSNGTALTGAALETAGVGLDFSTWTVNPVFNAGADGIDLFNEAAAICANPVGTNAEICPAIGSDTSGNPRGALAIVLDDQVISAPTINASSFDRENIVISGSFEEDTANDLAVALRYGALPLELETQQTRTVSATIGDDVLRSGLIAGIIGLMLVGVYLMAYYRLAGMVAIGGIVLSGMMLWTIIGYLGDRYGLAISVAGIVGLIVSIGVSADSNIVYFENVKDIAASGKRLGTSVERAYRSAISTIIKADVVSLIAAGLLYFLTVGAVKGFALYLGIATFLDLIVSLMFMRPALTWLASRNSVRQNPQLLGVPEGSK